MSSLGSLFMQWFGPPAAAQTPLQNASPARAHRDPAYPPVDTGLPAISVGEVIAPHAELLLRLRDAYGADRATFERDIAAVVERYAQFVHLLPATPDAYFRGAGGLFRMGLEVGFFALQATASAIFSGRQTITQRSALEPRWRYATFLAGLLSELHRTFTHFIVTSNHGHEWPAYLQPLSPWLREEDASRYYVRWRPHPPDARALGVVAMANIVPPQILQHLANGNSIVVPQLMASVSGTVLSREANTLDQLVRRASALVIDREMNSNVDLYGKPQLGSHLERYLIDAMRRLVAQGTWVANGEASRLWYAQDGMFVLWPQAAADMIALLNEDRLPGIPKSHETIAEILAAAGVLEPSGDGALLWDVFVPNAAASAGAVKIASPLLLASATDVTTTPLPRRLLELAVADKTIHATSQAQLALSIPEPRPVLSADRQQPPHPRKAAEELPAASATAARVPVTLNASARLSPTIRDALQQIIATLDAPSQPLAAYVIDLGVFVPLKEFESRNVDPALAVRALGDARMLASDPKQPASKTLSRDFDGESVLGLVLAPHSVAGLDQHSFGEQAQQASL